MCVCVRGGGGGHRRPRDTLQTPYTTLMHVHHNTLACLFVHTHILQCISTINAPTHTHMSSGQCVQWVYVLKARVHIYRIYLNVGVYLGVKV